jgi:hypothetical protein
MDRNWSYQIRLLKIPTVAINTISPPMGTSTEELDAGVGVGAGCILNAPGIVCPASIVTVVG